MVSILKIVFSKTLDHVEGKNISVENGDLVTVVNELKKQDGKDIVVYGGATFVSSLIKEGLIDELNFFINPVMINRGMRIFDQLNNRQKLSLITATRVAWKQTWLARSGDACAWPAIRAGGRARG